MSPSLPKIRRRSALIGGLAAAGIGPRSALATPVRSPAMTDWRDPAWRRAFPQLSFAERDRRWAALRVMMDREGVAALVLANSATHDHFGHYVSNDGTGVVVLPAAGEPVAFALGEATTRGAAIRAEVEASMGPGWISDWRFGQSHDDVVQYLKQAGLAAERLGAVGYQTSLPVGPYLERGGRSWNVSPFWRDVALRLPNASWVDLFWPFVDVASVKSDEEMAQFRKAAHLADLAAKAFVETMRPGVLPLEGQLAAAAAVQAFGGHTTSASGFRDSRRPAVAGELVGDETISLVGAMEAQAGYTVCLGDPSPELRRLIDTSDRMLAAGLAACRPGVSFAELEAAMTQPLIEEGYWHLAPLYKTLNPVAVLGTTGANLAHDMPGLSERFFEGRDPPATPLNAGDLKLREGMLVHLNPNGARGLSMVFLGINVRIRADAPELFSESTTRVHIKG